MHPREVVKLALQKSAAACIVYHNHPSAVNDPSHADEFITTPVRDALALIDVRTLDHALGLIKRMLSADRTRLLRGFARITETCCGLGHDDLVFGLMYDLPS